MRPIASTLCYVRRGGQTLMLHRRKQVGKIYDDKWNGLGGKMEAGETPEECVEREVWEETGLKVKVLKPYCTVKHAYTHFKITLKAFRCEYRSGRLRAKESAEVKWVAPDELDRYPFPTANKHVIAAIRASGVQPFKS